MFFNRNYPPNISVHLHLPQTDGKCILLALKEMETVILRGFSQVSQIRMNMNWVEVKKPEVGSEA